MAEMGVASLAFSCEEMGPWILSVNVYPSKRIRIWLLTDYGLLHLWLDPLTLQKTFTPKEMRNP